MPKKPTNPTAAEMANLRWAKTTPEQRSAHASMMASRRKRSGPLPLPRCECGAMSLARAAKRNHRCKR